ncbi:hypothetical protein BD770DRAFT_377343 [Pilaira anomala]|nr:hypothetical protein BD770DRAFT_377343 [Pilaira anomala]
MGFCQRCGEITTGKCSKCGGRSVASTISTLISESGMDRSDRWQTQYADTILAPEEISNKPALSSGTKIVSVTQSAFYNPIVSPTTSIKKVCCCCSKPMLTSYVQDNLSYCKECHLKLFSKGECPTCQKPVSDRDTWIEHGKNFWHADCFTCFNCKIPLDSNPLIDLKSRPCCEPCFNAQSGSTRNITRKKVSTGTLPLPPSPPPPPAKTIPRYDSYSSQSSLSSSGSITSELYLNQSRNISRRPRIDRDLFQAAIVTPPRTPSPAATTTVTTTTATNENFDTRRKSYIPRANTSSSTFLPRKTTPEPPSTHSISQRPCHYCYKPLGDASQKKTKIPIGDGLYAWFHKSCFLCSKCHLPFQDGQCATDGHSFYHSQCQVNQGCYGCKKSIGQDAFQFNDKMYHFDCFKCSGHGCKLGLGQPVFELDKLPYCEPCHDTIQSSTVVIRPNKPRSRALPKLGGSKTCPRCRQSISVMEDTPGPFTTRWHKKCLSCAGCSKQLDSAAKIKPGQQGESLVFCQKCY